MARFSANLTDSSDDEGILHETEQVRPSRQTKIAIAEGYTLDEGESEDEDDEDYENDEEHSDVEEPSDEEALSSEATSASEMDEDELVVLRSRKKFSANALVENSDGEVRYAREVNGRPRTYSPSSSSDSESPPHEPLASPVIPWAKKVGVDPQKLQIMQTSLFRVPEDEAALKAMTLPPRPKFQLSPAVHRKHSRDSIGDGLRSGPRERASFAHDMDPLPFRPTKKYARVQNSASVVAGNEGANFDAGLAMGRSFRVGWGPFGCMAHVGELCSPSTELGSSTSFSIVKMTPMPFYSQQDARESNTSRITQLLQHNLNHTPILLDEDRIPFASPSSEICFSSFASLYPPADRSYEGSLFRLGSALFDKIDLRLGPSVTSDIRNRILAIRRKAALSNWLEDAVIPLVDADLKRLPSTSSLAMAYTLLTGHQVDKSCEAAIDGGNVKLASLISQASGDFEFRADLRDQLQVWFEQRIDVHIDDNIRKIYAMLAGILDVFEGSKGSGSEKSSDIDLFKGLDWKRAFGMHLWFSEPLDVPIPQVYESYERNIQDSPTRVAQPRPWYIENPPAGPSSFKTPSSPPPDALFSLIRIYSDPACSLSHILLPLSFSSSPVDYSLPWHLYIILSRCMRIRDFSDRSDPGLHVTSQSDDGDSIPFEGHSPAADLLTSSYAQQLEQLGLLQEAIFVLLHIEGSVGREKAIRDLLSRSAEQLDEWMVQGIMGSLKIPLAWVNDAKATYAYAHGEVYKAYELSLEAGLFDTAHSLAVAELAPEAVIHRDFDLLKSLFEEIADQSVSNWHVKGKVFMDYARVMTRLPELRADLSNEDAIPDAAQASEVEEFARSIPKLIEILPDVLRDSTDPRHKVALAEMTSSLTFALGQLRPLALSQSQVRLSCADEATKLRHLQSTAYERFAMLLRVS